MKISILICTLPEPFRERHYISDLVRKLTFQAANTPVQILYLGDNKSMNVGKKRNLLLDISAGERIIFVDDDDMVTDNYVDKLLEYSNLDFDCISIGVRMTTDKNGDRNYDYTFKKNINTRQNGVNIAGRMPDHLCLWRKSVARRVMFADRNLGEDHLWAEQQLLKGYTFHDTKEILYHYDFRKDVTQTRVRI